MSGYDGIERRQTVPGWTALGLITVHHLIIGHQRKETHANLLVYMAIMVLKEDRDVLHQICI